ncbi:MAG: putative ABC exporter domain-containing protein [Clostridiales bacterium]|jgi:hypothetical protein|nr:putative ABC exporter domain-containing protein [Clostridiales bacterium]
MTALFYIVRKSVKNSLKELLRKPGKLALYLLALAVIAGVIVMSFFPSLRASASAPLFWFTGILFLYIVLFVVLAVVKGMSGGDAIFEMSDVNLLFVSPVDPRRILVYGVARMAKSAFFAGFFILFQANSLANFGIRYGGVLLTLAGFVLSVVVLLILSLLIYSATNGRPGRKRLVKLLAALPFLPLAVFAAASYLQTRDVLAAAEAAIQSPFLTFIPVAGWTAAGVSAFLSGATGAGLLYFGANLLLGIGLIVYLLFSNPDYYEDVLVATETAYEKKRALSEGNLSAATAPASGRRVRVKGTGIPFYGAAALFGKHARENFRENRFGFLTLPSALIAAGAILLTLFVRELWLAMQILMWMQIFLIGTGRGLKETYSHYIYMIPETSFRKILWSNMEIVARTLLESALIFGISGALLKSDAVYILVCAAAYTLFSLLLLGVNYVFMRFTGADISAGLLLFIYCIAVLLVMAPGVVLAVVIGSAVGGDIGFLTGLLVLCGWELAAGLVCFALSGGVLHHCDMPVFRTNK